MSHEHTTAKHAAFIELFFDLVFVFAVTQVAGFVRDHATPLGWARAAIVFALVWWAWTQYTWLGTGVDLDRRSRRAIMLAASVPTFFLAQAVPDAWGADGEWFAATYVFVRLIALGLFWWGSRPTPEHLHAVRAFIPLALFATIAVGAGGWLDPDLRLWVWVAALALEVLNTLLVGRQEWAVNASHFVERHGLFVIIVLGESIIAVGVATGHVERTGDVIIAAVIGLIGVAVLWWSYFDRLTEVAEEPLARVDAHRRGPLARDAFSLLHAPIIAGVILYAVALEEAVSHPEDVLSLAGRIALAGGVALFIGGMAAVRFRTTGKVGVERLIAVVLIAVAVVALASAPSAIVLGAVVAITAAAVAVEAALWRSE